MTNANFCATIMFMRKLSDNFRKYFVLLLPLLAIACMVFFAPKSTSANAQVLEYQNIFPLTQTEVFDLSLSSPKDALHFGKGCAIIKDDKTLWLSIDGQEYSKYTKLVHNNPIQVKALSDQTLVINDDNILYVVDINNLSAAPLPLNYEGSSVNASYFDINSNYLVTFSGNTVTRYTFNNGTIVDDSKLVLSDFAEAQSPACVDNKGNVYFIKSDASVWVYQESQTMNLLYKRTDKITHLLTDGEFIYLIEGDFIKKLNIADKTIVDFTYNEDPDFDLGKVIKPVSLSFYGENLFVSDSGAQAVCEYKIKDNLLDFTGFAVAKNKTAFNRAGQTALDVERFNDKLAMLLPERVIIVDYDKDFTPYDKQNFINLSTQDLGEQFPNAFALGKDSLIFAYNNFVKKYDLATKSLSQQIDFGSSVIKDVCYQNGYYFVLTNQTTSSTTFKIDENTFTTVSTNEYDSSKYSCFTVDVFGQEFLTDNPQITKMASDLKGDVFFIKNGKFYLLDQVSGGHINLTFELPEQVKSFALGFEDQKVNFALDGIEFTLVTDKMEISGINGTQTPPELIVTGTNANNARFVTVDQNANLYGVDTINGQFKFTSLKPQQQVYIFICNVEQLEHSVLLGSDGLVLCNNALFTDCQNATQVPLQKDIFITTDVNAYYLPLITPNDSFVITKDGNPVRLSKGQQLNAVEYFEFNGSAFYKVTFEKDGENLTAFVPSGFVADILWEDVVNVNYTLECVRQTVVYQDAQLKTKITTLAKGENVKVYAKNGKVATIKYFDGQNWVDGYINQEDIQNKPNKAVRNTLIVLAVIACSCGTVTYFVMRKKNEQ